MNKLNSVKNVTTSVKNHVHKHRAKYAVVTTAAAFTALMMRNAEDWNNFLKEHNLYDEYYKTEEED